MKKNKMWLLLVPVMLLAVALIGVSGYLLVQNNERDEYAQYIQLAKEKIEAQDFDGAIEAYEAAILLDDQTSTAYEGLARVYFATGETEKLETIINRYETATNDSFLRTLYADDLKQLQEEMAVAAEEQQLKEEQAKEVDKLSEVTLTEEVSLDSNLLTFFAGATYSDYLNSYGEPLIESSGSTSVVQYQLAPIICTYSAENGVVTVDGSGKPFSESRPSSIQLSNLSMLLSGMTGETTFDVLKSDSALQSATVVTSEGTSYVTFEASGCSVKIASDENGTISGTDAWNEIRILEVAEETESCTLSGSVISATTNSGVSDATLCVRSGIDNTDGSALEEIKADGVGYYQLDLEPGNYTFEISAPGYITEFFAVEIFSWYSSDSMNFVISPELNEGEIRIVLEWGSFPWDLDSYLIGTDSSGRSVNINFMNMRMTGVAALDVDCVSGYGPETVTIADIGGSYQFVVKDFQMTGTMAQSGAVVKIYMPGSTTPEIVSVPSDVDNEWLVCSIDDGTLTIENRAYG